MVRTTAPTGADVVQVLRDQRDRGRDIEGIIKQWFAYVKPNFEKVSSFRHSLLHLLLNLGLQFVDPQRKVADIIVPRGVENQVAMCKYDKYRPWRSLSHSNLSSYGGPVHQAEASRKVNAPPRGTYPP